MNGIKKVAGILVMALACWLLFALVREPAQAEVQAKTFTSSQQCKECHPEVFAEWEGSWHAKSWEDEDVRALSNDFANTDCIDCHAPRPIFESGIGKRVLPRTSRRHEGVDCISCHALPEGGVAGSIESTRAACRPVARVELTRADFCGVCHDQHKTVQQWKETTYANQGIACIDCHMPHRNDASGSPNPSMGRNHTMAGGHDLGLIQGAIELRAERTQSGWNVLVENVAVGHHYPTDERSRASDLFWRPQTAGEPGPWRHLYRFRDPYRHETDLPSTLLPHGETRSVPLEVPDVAGPIEVALFYKLTPYWADPERPDPEREARLVHRLTLTP